MKHLILIILITVVTGCNNNDNSQQNENSPLLGTWETQTCEEVTSSGLGFSIWSKATYEFLQNGGIIFSPKSYTDSTCTIIAFNTFGPAGPIATFLDLGETILEEGIPGNKLNIEIQTPDQTVSTDGFYTINNNILCFSLSYSFEPTTFSISLSERTPIDFTTCLVPVNEP